MKVLIITSLLFLSLVGTSQTRPAPFEEAKKAMIALDQASFNKDSLRKVYAERMVLDFTFGFRFILPYNESIADSITFADFTERRSFFGLGFGYFVTKNLLLHLGTQFTILPKNQEITSIAIGSGGISAEGKGNGGAIINFSLRTHYYFSGWKFTRPYVGVALGTTHLVAKGGEASIGIFNGRADQIERSSVQLPTGQVLVGLSFRTSPGFILDYNVGYTQTKKGDSIGGITSPGGITTSLTFQFILNPGKK